MRVYVTRYRPNPKAATHKKDFNSGFEIKVEDILSGPTLEELIPDGWREDLHENHRIIKKEEEFERVECICEGEDSIPFLPGKEYKLEFKDDREPEMIVSGELNQVSP